MGYVGGVRITDEWKGSRPKGKTRLNTQPKRPELSLKHDLLNIYECRCEL